MLLLQAQSSGTHAGILANSKLTSALYRFPLKLDATLTISDTKDTRQRAKARARKPGSREATRDYKLRIILYGLLVHKRAIGNTFTDAGFFIQHPSADEVMPNVQHQITALAMMQEKENGFVEEPMFPSLWKTELSKDGQTKYYRHTITNSLVSKPDSCMGGILADDMGLGKTLSMLALICCSLDFHSTTRQSGQDALRWGTLIVAPKSTLQGWVDQALRHIKTGHIRIRVYHGASRDGVAAQFSDTDIIVTTYETLRSEWATTKGARPLFSWKWLRIVLDEAHHIRNRSKQLFQSTCHLKARYRWCLTGTPIHNHLDDYGALLSFIGVSPFQQKSSFSFWIVNPLEKMEEIGSERLRRLIRATCLRRTKQNTLSSGEVELPRHITKIHEVHLSSKDQALYDNIKEKCAAIAAGLEKRADGGRLPKGSGSDILRHINFLRIICDHGLQLLSDAARRSIESRSSSPGWEPPQLFTASCSVCGEEINYDAFKCDKTEYLCTSCASCASSDLDPRNTDREANPPGDEATSVQQDPGTERSYLSGADYQPSAKVQALLQNLKQEQMASGFKPRKSVVFSCWVKMLDLIQQAFYTEQIKFQRIDGQTTLERRQKAMQEFKEDTDCMVMLATIGSCAEGVDLVAAGVVHLIEPHWNPMVEKQAVDRVYRIGQTQNVTIIRYIVPNSVETYIQRMQEEKMRIIDNATNMTSAELESQRWERMTKILA
ncbi:SNF2 family N-terminal domain-containing protein [Nemania sp. FL0916]|nr:SNF2 family N-terminal domain-containing protein [Nemania sp. FL0916]